MKTRRGKNWACMVWLFLLAVCALPSGQAQSRPGLDDTTSASSLHSEPAESLASTPPQSVRHVLVVIGEVWLAEDHAALSRLVAQAGVKIAIAPEPDRDNVYSRSQAFYFFKNLFRSTKTDSFAFRRVQEEAEGELVHAVALWRYQRSSSNANKMERLFFTLTREQAGWRLSEIRSLR
jgi:hypothetical protein